MERVWSTSRRGFSARSILTFVLTVFITALLWVTFGSQAQTHAEGPVGNWVGDTILYDGHSYNANTEATKNNTLGLPEGTKYYTYAPAGSNNTGVQVKTVKAFVIYFTPGTDPPTATTATFVTYDYLPSKGYSNPSGKMAITMTPNADKGAASSCSVDGIGWIICPVTIFLAKGMDFIFGQVANFMAVQPLMVNDPSSSLFVAWNIMRSIANIAFIIVFLIIIYSQLTNAVVSNYGIKKLLPRLIIAALLVNLSYIICSIAIDISNILGYSLQHIFVTIRENTFSITNDTWSASTTAWTTVTTAILSGVGLGIVVADPGVLFALIPIIVGVLLTALVVLLILAARQAIIVILIIIAPLAFVAYLLPNTEQWFKKWRELFMTMLIFFPALSLVFGGSQLASSIILQNASTMMMIVLGLAVQVAPLVITPIILKFSGGVLGKIGGLVNNPKKGLMDRTKNWTNLRRDRSRHAALANPNTKNPFRRVAQQFAYNNRRVEKGTEKYKAQFEDWSAKRDVTSSKGQAIEVDTALAKLSTEETQHKMEQAMQELRAGDSSGLRQLRTERSMTTIEQIRMTRIGGGMTEEEITTRREVRIDKSKSFAKYAIKSVERAVELDQSSRIIASATASAQSIQLQNFAKAIDSNTQLQVRAGGIDPNGAQRALANAFAVMSKARGETIENAGKIIDYRNLSDEQIRQLSEGIVAPGVNVTLTQDIRAAALKRTLGGPNTEQIELAMQNIDFSFAGLSAENREELQVIASEALGANSARPPEVSAGVIGRMKQGLDFNGNAFTGALGVGGVRQMIVSAVNNQKLDAGKLQGAGRDYSQAIFNMLRDPVYAAQLTPDAKVRLKAELRTVLDPSREASERLGDSKPFLENIEKLL